MTRHIIYPVVAWSVYTHSPAIAGRGCFRGPANHVEGPFPSPPGYGYMLDPFLYSDGLICYNHTVMWGFFGPILVLQGLLIVWFAMILRVAARVLRGGSADDVRSDGENEDVDESEDYICEQRALIEETVGADQLIIMSCNSSSANSKRTANSTGISLPSPSTRKELLGRIGCDSRVE